MEDSRFLLKLLPGMMYVETVFQMVRRDVGFSTRAVHSGEVLDPSSGSFITPIYQSAVFSFKDAKHLLDVVKGKVDGNIYTRYGNPTLRVAEEKVAALEGAEDSLAFSSGMAAISAAILANVSSGDRIISVQDLYGGTYELFNKFLPRFGIQVKFVESTNQREMEEAARSNCSLIYAETPTNPTMKIVDLRAVARLAEKVGAISIVDNTFATPYNQRPLDLGIDLVIHSATKYLNGHDDVVAGIVAGSKELIRKIMDLRRVLGGVLDPHAGWLLIRGLKTLGIRVEKQNSNAMKAAKFMEDHRKIERVYYPGLRSHPQHRLASRQMRGYGGILSFEIKGGGGAASRFVERFELGYLAPSLGGVETLVMQPATSSHYHVPLEERVRAGITDRLIRVSFGIEEIEDILLAIDNALAKA